MKQPRESSNGGVGVARSAERLRQITNEQGQTRAKAQRAQAEQVVQEAVSREQIRAKPRTKLPRFQPDPTSLGAGGTGWGSRALA